MKVMVLYQPNTEHERQVLTFSEDIRRSTGRSVDLISLDTKEGAEIAKLYDIFNSPSVIAVNDDGVLQQLWSDGNLPLMNDVLYYLS